jgi:tRNA(Ile)-lysidine synthase
VAGPEATTPDALGQVRRAVRDELSDLRAPDLVLVALSGGPDSLGLAAAAALEAARQPWRAGAVVVDHGLQPGSAAVAERAAEQATGLGLSPVEVVAVTVAGEGGPEAAARRARTSALESAATRLEATVVLLGHTLDDQAETVLLGLARGSGARSLAGMPRRRGVFRRPLLGLRRSLVAAACAESGLEPWSDPHNDDRTFTRSHVRADVVPTLVRALGDAVPAALARTADRLREDDEALSEWAAALHSDLLQPDGGLDAAALARAPTAVRARVLRLAALQAGVPGGSLATTHLHAMDALVSRWHGQGEVALPGRVVAGRRCGRLYLGQARDVDS